MRGEYLKGIDMKNKWITRKKFFVTFLILTGLLMIAILSGLFWEVHRAGRALHNFNDALVAKDYARAYAMTSSELQASTSYQSFVKIHDDLDARLGSLTQVDVNQTEAKDQSDGWYATADTRMIFVRGSLPFTFILKKESGAWKIYSYHEQ